MFDFMTLSIFTPIYQYIILFLVNVGRVGAERIFELLLKCCWKVADSSLLVENIDMHNCKGHQAA